MIFPWFYHHDVTKNLNSFLLYFIPANLMKKPEKIQAEKLIGYKTPPYTTKITDR